MNFKDDLGFQAFQEKLIIRMTWARREQKP